MLVISYTNKQTPNTSILNLFIYNFFIQTNTGPTVQQIVIEKQNLISGWVTGRATFILLSHCIFTSCTPLYASCIQTIYIYQGYISRDENAACTVQYYITMQIHPVHPPHPGWPAGHEQGLAAWPSDPLASSVTCWITNWSSILARYHIYGPNSPPWLILLPRSLHAYLRVTKFSKSADLNLSEYVHCPVPPAISISTVLQGILLRYSADSSFPPSDTHPIWKF